MSADDSSECKANPSATDAEPANPRQVLTALGALSESQGWLRAQLGAMGASLTSVERLLDSIEQKVEDTATRVRSLEQGLAGMRGLLLDNLRRK